MSIDKKKPDTSPADGVNTAADEAPDLDAVMRKYDRESATRLWEGTPQLIIRILMAAFGLFCIGMTLFSKAMPEIRLAAVRGLHHHHRLSDLPRQQAPRQGQLPALVRYRADGGGRGLLLLLRAQRHDADAPVHPHPARPRHHRRAWVF